MSWFALGAATVGLVKGKMDGDANKKRQGKLDASRKAQIQYSPWTGMGDPGAVNAGPTGGDAMLGGAMQGAMVGQSMGNLDFSGASKPLTGSADFGKVSGNGWSGADGIQGTQLPAANIPQQQPGSAGAIGGGGWDRMQAQQQRPKSMDPTKNYFNLA